MFACLLVEVAASCSLLEALEDLIKRLLVSDPGKPEILKYLLRSRPYGYTFRVGPYRLLNDVLTRGESGNRSDCARSFPICYAPRLGVGLKMAWPSLTRHQLPSLNRWVYSKDFAPIYVTSIKK